MTYSTVFVIISKQRRSTTSHHPTRKLFGNQYDCLYYAYFCVIMHLLRCGNLLPHFFIVKIVTLLVIFHYRRNSLLKSFKLINKLGTEKLDLSEPMALNLGLCQQCKRNLLPMKTDLIWLRFRQTQYRQFA